MSIFPFVTEEPELVWCINEVLPRLNSWALKPRSSRIDASLWIFLIWKLHLHLDYCSCSLSFVINPYTHQYPFHWLEDFDAGFHLQLTASCLWAESLMYFISNRKNEIDFVVLRRFLKLWVTSISVLQASITLLMCSWKVIQFDDHLLQTCTCEKTPDFRPLGRWG